MSVKPKKKVADTEPWRGVCVSHKQHEKPQGGPKQGSGMLGMELAVSRAVEEEETCQFSVKSARRPKPEGMVENEAWLFQHAFW